MSVLKQIEDSILPSASIKQYGAASASVAILDNDVLQTHVFTANEENPDTLYMADSDSKAIMALGLARLVDQGLLTFTDRIVNYIDVGAFLHHAECVDLAQHVTIQMLMTHTSGLVRKTTCDHTQMLEFSGRSCWHFAHLPGSKWYYDNALSLVQYAMENVTGKSYPELMQDLVTKPLGMSRTFWGQLPAEETNFAKPHFQGSEVKLPSAYHHTELSAYGMWTTPSDMLRALCALQKSLQASTPFLTQHSASYILIEGAVPMRTGEDLGLGWFVTPTAFGHRGCRGTNGFHSYFFGFRGEASSDLACASLAVMTNSFEGLEAIRALVKAIMFLKVWPRQVSMPSNLGIDGSLPCLAPSSAAVDARWKKWLGNWSRVSQSGWSLIKVNEKPMLKFRDMEAVSLQPAAAPCLKFTDNKTEHTFVCAQLGSMGGRLTWSNDERIVELLYQYSPIALTRDAEVAYTEQ